MFKNQAQNLQGFLSKSQCFQQCLTGQNQGFLLYLNLVYSITHQKGFCSTAGRKSECLRKLFQIISIYSSVCLVTLLSFSTMSSTGFFSSRAKIISLLFCSCVKKKKKKNHMHFCSNSQNQYDCSTQSIHTLETSQLNKSHTFVLICIFKSKPITQSY